MSGGTDETYHGVLQKAAIRVYSMIHWENLTTLNYEIGNRLFLSLSKCDSLFLGGGVQSVRSLFFLTLSWRMGKFFASDSSVDQVDKEKSHGDVKMLDFSEYMGSSDLWKWTLELLEQTCIYLVSFLVCLLKAWM